MDRHHARTTLLAAAVTTALLLPSASHAARQGQEPDPANRPCFIEPPRWNEALDGPLPRCPLHPPAPPAPPIDKAGEDHARPGLPIL